MASDPSAKSVFQRVLLALQSAGVPYMLTGSFASAFHGSPRTTQDIDIVIAPTLGSLNAMLKLFPSDSYYVSREAALQAYGNEGLFNVIDFESGWKIDLIIRKSRPFSLEEFDRRREVLLLGTSVAIASPEDVIIAKLEWSKMSESERQLRDVAGIVKTQADNLDGAYIESWVVNLQLETQWAKAKALAV